MLEVKLTGQDNHRSVQNITGLNTYVVNMSKASEIDP